MLIVSVTQVLITINPSGLYISKDEFSDDYKVEAECIAEYIMNNPRFKVYELAYAIQDIFEDLFEYEFNLVICFDIAEAIIDDIKWGWGLAL